MYILYKTNGKFQDPENTQKKLLHPFKPQEEMKLSDIIFQSPSPIGFSGAKVLFLSWEGIFAHVHFSFFL